MTTLIVCELPVRLSEIAPVSREDSGGVSVSALEGAMDMLGGPRSLVAKVHEVLPTMDERRSQYTSSSEYSTFTFDFSPDNPFSNSMYA